VNIVTDQGGGQNPSNIRGHLYPSHQILNSVSIIE
jgi:hypothetical protein